MSDDVEQRSVQIDKRVPQVADACDNCWTEKSAQIAEIMAPGRSKTIADREAMRVKKLITSLGARARSRNGASNEAAARALPEPVTAAKKTAAKRVAATRTTAKKTTAKKSRTRTS